MGFGKLTIQMPDGHTREFPLEKAETSIGRSKENDLAIEHITVSRRHAILRVDPGSLFLQDLGSANGSFIGDQQITPNTLNLVSPNQVMRVGEIVLRYFPPITTIADEEEHTLKVRVPVIPPKATAEPVTGSLPRQMPATPAVPPVHSTATKSSTFLEFSKILIPVIGTLLAACLTAVFAPLLISLVNSKLSATRTAQPPPLTATPNITLTPWVETLREDFSNNDRNWYVGDVGEFARIALAGGGIRISILKGPFYAWTTNFETYENLRMEVDIAQLQGQKENEMGFFCRFQDDNNLYMLGMTASRRYGIAKKEKGTLTMLTTGVIPASITLKSEGFNHLRGDCSGQTLALYVNGVKLAEVQDQSFTRGRMSIYAGGATGDEFLFDNLMLYKR
ncbi:MAG TPA: FHA domain-containing protein [Anaerolineaceae bacterium]